MTSLYMRSNVRDLPTDKDYDRVVGPLSEQRKGEIKHTIHELFCRPRMPVLPVWSFLHMSLAVFAADKMFSRWATEDCWTRDIEISIPVHEEIASLVNPVEKCLNFLTGDRWTVEFRRRSIRPKTRRYYPDDFRPDAVSLFSGGIDSLTQAINMLEEGQKVLLIGHHDFSFTAGVQKHLAALLQKHYGSENVKLKQVEVKILNKTDDSTRGRSLLFIALGLVAASSFGDEIPLYVPENGYIGINVPLTPGRLGSYSTRTTHPKYFDYLREILAGLGLSHEIVNPFKYRSKGMVLESCQNPDLLRKMFVESISCAHPIAGRWQRYPPGNCGYCFPCLIRRASAHRISWDSPDDYLYDAIGKPDIILDRRNKSEDLIGLLLLVHRFKRSQLNFTAELLKSGSLGSEYSNIDKYARAFREGTSEVLQLIEAKACDDVRAFVE